MGGFFVMIAVVLGIRLHEPISTFWYMLISLMVVLAKCSHMLACDAGRATLVEISQWRTLLYVSMYESLIVSIVIRTDRYLKVEKVRTPRDYPEAGFQGNPQNNRRFSTIPIITMQLRRNP